MKTDILNMAILSGAFLLLFATAEILYHFFKIKVEWTRKLVHFGTGMLTLLFPILLDNHWLVLALCSSFTLILLASLKYNLLPSINAIERKSYGSIAYPLAVYGSYWAFDFLDQNYLFFYLPILILAICDPVAALMGKRFPYGKFKVACGTKTLMGSGMFFLSALLITASMLYAFDPNIDPTQLWLRTGAIAMVAMLAEAVSGKGLDNISIPSAVLFTLVFYG